MQTDIKELQQAIQGELLLPGSSEYTQASTVYVKQGQPRLIVRPTVAEDITRALAFAQKYKLIVSIRSGGHSNAGYGTNDGGLVIDMLHFNRVELLDEAAHTVRIGAGLTWGEAAMQLGKYGLAISSGDTKDVGVGGLTLGGGIGVMVRRDGLAIDNLIEAEIVTADGTVRTANEQNNSDLFWALRGGGGNFGVVTRFTFTAQPTSHIYTGTITYSMEQRAAVLKGFNTYLPKAPNALKITAGSIPAAFAPPAGVLNIRFYYSEDDEEAAKQAVEPLLQLGDVQEYTVTRRPYAEALEETRVPEGMQVLTVSAFYKYLDDELIDLIQEDTEQILQIHSLGGAMSHVPIEATAFAYRQAKFLIVSPVFVPLDVSPVEIQKVLAPWREMTRLSSGAYVNFLSVADNDEVRAAYTEPVYQKLARIKQLYDPHNLFNQNHNIVPANSTKTD